MAEPSTPDYWRAFVRWLELQPVANRVPLLQLCVQQKGPAPDDLRPTIERLIKEAS